MTCAYVPTVEESIASNNAVTRDEVAAFHRGFYGASNAELSIVGDFDPDATRALVTQLFGSWQEPRPYTRVPDPYRANQAAAIRLVAPDKANAFLIGRQALPLDDLNPDYPALLVASFILGDSASARIPERLRQKDGLSYGAGTSFQPSAIDANSAMAAYAIFAPQNLERVRTGLAEEMTRAVKDGFTDAEVERRQVGRAAGAPPLAAPRMPASLPGCRVSRSWAAPMPSRARWTRRSRSSRPPT